MSSSKSKMSVVQLTILTVINMMGSGIIMLPSKLAQVGTISILSWLVTAVGSMCLAYAFAKCGRFSTKSGGMGGYAEYSFGKSGNFMANYTYAVSLLIANVAIAISAVGYLAVLMNWQLSPFQAALGAIIFVWLTMVANFGGAGITGKISGITVWGAIIPVIGVSIIGWFWFSPSMYADAWNPHNMGLFEAIPSSIAITLWAFLGLESACANSDAVDNPEKNVPIAVLWGTLLTAIIYIVSTNVVAGIVPNTQLASTDAPFGLVFASMFNNTIGQIVMGLLIISCTGSLLGWQFTIAQVFKAGADEGYFIPQFGKATSNNTPILGMIIIASIQTVLALMTMDEGLSKQFDILVNLAVVTNLIPYILSMSAIIVLQKTSDVPHKEMVFTSIIAFIGNLYSFYALYSSGMEAMYWGSIAVFAGWVLYGKVVSRKYDLNEPF
ncbi:MULTISPECIES: putrescine-ornithine antiporter [Neisseria]|uniref:Putrescine transporter n=1 Tax=Neisseria musculi TaxID=1815583 RepID=A0A7H1ME53_9NEIS|nr:MULTISPECIES: putrescine-ornithine antiporter [Neisseria]MBF0805011.1 putrescine-ornithine antiporter [Neisseria sp. 19428wB4_WF04]QNT59918.1 putrescine-ornithine antiporter [Neisseria musculi]TFU39252.1 putrescine-ornithine antiporter [Neisseria sp. WF04]